MVEERSVSSPQHNHDGSLACRRFVWNLCKISREFFFPVLNLIAFCVNFAGPYRNLASRTDEAPTLLRPINYSFSIWIVIYVLLAMFVLYSFLPRTRKSAILRRGVSVLYFLSVLFCIGWGVAFAKSFTAALVMLALVWVVLALLMLRIYRFRRLPYFATFLERRNLSTVGLIEDFQNENVTTKKDFWFIQVPFSLYFGWITAAFVTQINILISSLNPDNATKQFTGALCSLLALVAVGSGVSLAPQRGDAVVPLALAWAGLGVGLQLFSSSPPLFSAEEDRLIVVGFRNAAWASSALFLLLSVVGAGKTYKMYWKDRLQGIEMRNELIWRDSISRHMTQPQL